MQVLKCMLDIKHCSLVGSRADTNKKLQVVAIPREIGASAAMAVRKSSRRTNELNKKQPPDNNDNNSNQNFQTGSNDARDC